VRTDENRAQARPTLPANWCLKRPAVRCEVACGDAVHHLRWERGKIILEDHDLTAEETLAYLGAPETGCVALLGAWRRRQLSLLPGDLAAVAGEAEDVTRWRTAPRSPTTSAVDERFRRLTTSLLTDAFRQSQWRRSGREIAVIVRFQDGGSPPHVSSWGVSERSRSVEGVEVTVDSRWATRVGRLFGSVSSTVVLAKAAVGAPRPDRRAVWIADWADGGLRARVALIRRTGAGWALEDSDSPS